MSHYLYLLWLFLEASRLVCWDTERIFFISTDFALLTYTLTIVACHYDPSFASHPTPVEKFFKSLYNLPWNGSPLIINRVRCFKRPVASWYRAVVPKYFVSVFYISHFFFYSRYRSPHWGSLLNSPPQAARNHSPKIWPETMTSFLRPVSHYPHTSKVSSMRVSDMSGVETRGLFVRPYKSLYQYVWGNIPQILLLWRKHFFSSVLVFFPVLLVL